MGMTEDYVHAEIDGIYKALAERSFIFENDFGDHIIPFSQCLMITGDEDYTVKELQQIIPKLRNPRMKIESVQIPRWLAKKQNLAIIDEE